MERTSVCCRNSASAVLVELGIPVLEGGEDVNRYRHPAPWALVALLAIGWAWHAGWIAWALEWADYLHWRGEQVYIAHRWAVLAGGFVAGVVLLAGLIRRVGRARRYRKALLQRHATAAAIQTMASWRDFELLVGEALRRQGFTVTETGGGGADGGCDLLAERGGRRWLVQCKHWQSRPVGVATVREVLGVVSARTDLHGAIVAASGGFSRHARAQAQRSEGRVVLLAGEDLLDLSRDPG